jgi:hypothetical protein
MKKTFSLKKKPGDVYAFSMLMMVLSFLIVFTNIYNRPGGDLFVSVYIENQYIEQYSLYTEQEIRFSQATYPVLLGDIVLAIEDERIRIVEETSPLNICSQQGWVATPGLPLICAPNYFMAIIEAART